MSVPERRMSQAKEAALADTNFQSEIASAFFEDPLRDICPL